MKFVTTIVLISIVAISGFSQQSTSKYQKRFFSDSSFWNQPISSNPVIHPMSEKWIEVLKQEPGGAFFGINTDKYTIPVYEVDENTPTQTIQHRTVNENFKKIHGHNNHWFETNQFYGHGKGFGQDIPIPLNVIYAQGLYKTSPVNWEGKLRGWKAGLVSIPLHNYRVIKTGEPMKGGLNSQELDKAYFQIPKEKLGKILNK